MIEDSWSSRNQEVKITNFYTIKPFIKVQAQLANKTPHQSLIHLKDIFEKSKELNDSDVVLGEVYIAKLDEQRYARCRINELDDFSSMALVQYFDAGNSGRIPYTRLRLLPKSSSLHDLLPFSKEFIIGELMLSSTQNDDFPQRLNKFSELVLNNVFNMVILSKNEIGVFVDLRSTEASISHDIILNHPALRTIFKRIKLDDQIKLMKEQNNAMIPIESNNCIHLPEFSNELTITSSDTLLDGSSLDGNITAYGHGPNLLNVMLLKKLKDYQRFQIELKECHLDKLNGPAKVLEIYVAKLNGEFYRAVALEKQLHEVKIRLLDQGKEKIIPSGDLYLLPNNFKDIESFTTRISLFNSEELTHIDKNVLNFYFEYLTKDKRLKFQIISSKSDDEGLYYKCMIFVDNHDIYELLKNYNPEKLQYKQQPHLQSNEKHKVEISYIESPKLFYVNISSIENLENDRIIESLNEFNSCVFKNPKYGNVCCVNYLNKNYRGVIIETEKDSRFAKVHLIDIGLIEDILLNQIKVLVPKFTTVPARAYKCALNQLSSVDPTDEINKWFQDICDSNETYSMIVVNHIDDTYYVELEIENEINIVNTQPIQGLMKSRSSTHQESKKTKIIYHCIRPSNASKVLKDVDWTQQELESGSKSPNSSIESVDNSYLSTGFPCCGEEFNVIITSIASPNNFTIQSVMLLDELKKLLNELESDAENEEPLGVFTTRSICYAKSPFYNKWVRGIIIEASKDKSGIIITVKDIDTGHVFCLTNVENLKKPKLSLFFRPPFGIKCTLPICQVSQENDEEATKFLDEFKDKEVQCKILAANEEKNIVSLYYAGKSIAGQLINAGLALKLYILPNGLGTIPHVEDLKEFYVNLNRDNSEFNDIKSYTMNYQYHEEKSPNIGKNIMAKSKNDGYWYRAKIVNIISRGDRQFEVQFIDFGNRENVTEIGKIDNLDTLDIQPQAHLCSLYLSQAYNPFSKAAIEKFRQMTQKGSQLFTIRLEEPTEDKSIVSVYLNDEKNILSELIPLCEIVEKPIQK